MSNLPKPDEIAQALRTIQKINLCGIEVKAPTNLTILKIEINGSLLIFHGQIEIFGKTKDITRVYRVVK